MIIIIGLGNPGKKFENTRHNVGFMVIDSFAKKNNFADFKLDNKSNSLITEGIVNTEKILLSKPQTFMNDSGKTAKELLSQTESDSLIVIHDDIDLPVGKMKIVLERGPAGHKGVESIIKNIGNKGLIRFRIGIGGKKDIKAMKVVLKKFSKNEQSLLDETINRSVDALDLFIVEGLEKAMNKFNQ